MRRTVVTLRGRSPSVRDSSDATTEVVLTVVLKNIPYKIGDEGGSASGSERARRAIVRKPQTHVVVDGRGLAVLHVVGGVDDDGVVGLDVENGRRPAERDSGVSDLLRKTRTPHDRVPCSVDSNGNLLYQQHTEELKKRHLSVIGQTPTRSFASRYGDETV